MINLICRALGLNAYICLLTFISVLFTRILTEIDVFLLCLLSKLFIISRITSNKTNTTSLLSQTPKGVEG